MGFDGRTASSTRHLTSHGSLVRFRNRMRRSIPEIPFDARRRIRQIAPNLETAKQSASAKAVFERWPTPIVFSGFEIGRDLPYPAASIERDFGYVALHPMAESYKAYKKMPYDRPTWDLTAVL